MLTLFSISFLITTILIVWFETDAFIDYCKLFNVFKRLTTNFTLANNITFPQWLFVTYKNGIKNRFTLFLLKLVTCPICLSLWLAIIFGVLLGVWMYIPCFYIISLFTFLLFKRIIS